MIKITILMMLAFSLIVVENIDVSAQGKARKSVSKADRAKTGSVQNSAAPKLKTKAPAFELEDQFNQKFAFEFPAKKVTVFVFGDRKGAEQIEGWVRPLYEKFTDKIEIHGIAELSAVPWIAKGFVRNAIKSKSKTPVMLDWSGKVSKDYGSESDKANLFVVSKAGEIIGEKRGAATTAELENLYELIGGELGLNVKFPKKQKVTKNR